MKGKGTEYYHKKDKIHSILSKDFWHLFIQLLQEFDKLFTIDSLEEKWVSSHVIDALHGA
jgi:hypothetical protein